MSGLTLVPPPVSAQDAERAQKAARFALREAVAAAAVAGRACEHALPTLLVAIAFAGLADPAGFAPRLERRLRTAPTPAEAIRRSVEPAFVPPAPALDWPAADPVLAPPDLLAALLAFAHLPWRALDSDIFTLIVAATADRGQRAAHGQHFTDRPTARRLLDPMLFDDLDAALAAAGDDRAALLALRTRLQRVTVFDPACGTGNLLAEAYRGLRTRERIIAARLDENAGPSVLSLDRFRGIEIDPFAAVIAELALLTLARGAGEPVRPRILACNALALPWEPFIASAKADALIVANPPFRGTKHQSAAQKADLKTVFAGAESQAASLDYAAAFVLKAADAVAAHGGRAALLATNSLCQGVQVPRLWPAVFARGARIAFAAPSFAWTQDAAAPAGVTVVVLGLERASGEATGTPYLTRRLPPVLVTGATRPASPRPAMSLGNQPYEGGHLLLSDAALAAMNLGAALQRQFIRPAMGAAEALHSRPRHAIWIADADAASAHKVPALAERIERVRAFRLASRRAATRAMAAAPHRFCERHQAKRDALLVPIRSSERRPYLPVALVGPEVVVTNLAYVLYDAPRWAFAILVSKLHLAWIAGVCGRLETRLSYSNRMGWNTFPLPALGPADHETLTDCADAILAARAAHRPATLAALYDAAQMPAALRAAHQENDAALERLYRSAPFADDQDRLAHLLTRYGDAQATSIPSRCSPSRTVAAGTA